MRQQIHGSILFVYRIERAPASHIGLVSGARIVPLYIAAILVPGELHPLFRSLDHPLLMEQKRIRADRGLGNLPHKIAEDELPHAWTQSIAVVDEVALAAMAQVFCLRSPGIHQGIVVAK